MSSLSRRSWLARALATAGVMALSACERGSQIGTRLLVSAESLTKAAQRLILPRDALAPEYEASQISADFRPNGSIDPAAADYLALKANGFADYRLEIGGLVEIVPLFTIETTIERVQGMRPYSPLELAGRNIYIREGCYLCHSQQVRPFKDEVERYGHYSLASESMYDHPFLWGSERTGPDLARVGGRYSDEWHRQHLTDPRSVVPESIMPG